METSELQRTLEKVFDGKSYLWKSKNRDWIFFENESKSTDSKNEIYEKFLRAVYGK